MLISCSEENANKQPTNDYVEKNDLQNNLTDSINDEKNDLSEKNDQYNVETDNIIDENNPILDSEISDNDPQQSECNSTSFKPVCIDENIYTICENGKKTNEFVCPADSKPAPVDIIGFMV